MMQVSETQFDGAVPVDGYGPGFFRVGGQVIEGPVLVSADGPHMWGGLTDVATLMELVGKVDVLFCGMGADISHLPKALRENFEAEGIGVEVMSSPSAARTYNVLLGEGRRVAAALLPV
jgi:uncharacterized protein